MVAVISGGTIPDRGLYTVNLPDRTRLGELDEEFVHETRVGDVFQLGSSTWRVNTIEHDRVIVTPAPGAPARMPFWHGEYSARSSHLASAIGTLRRELDAARTPQAVDEITTRYGCDEATAQSLVEYVHEQRAATGACRRTLARRRTVPRRDERRSRRDPRAVRRPGERSVGDGSRASGARGPRARRRRSGADDGRRSDAALPDLRDWVPLSLVRRLILS